MCIAIMQPRGQRVPEDILCRAAFNNPDGAGYAYVDEYGVVQSNKGKTFKGIKSQLRIDLDTYANDSDFLIHFRIATHGDVCVDNAHPFPLKGGGMMIHNGILDIPGLPEGHSDSRYFAKNVISKLPANWYRTPHWPEYLEDIILTNKIVCIYPDQTIILNEKLGDWKGGVWYSNSSAHTVYHAYPPAISVEDYDQYGYCSLPSGVMVPVGGVKWKDHRVTPMYKPAPTHTVNLGSWEEMVYIMAPTERRKLVQELMREDDISMLSDDDIEDFMLELRIPEPVADDAGVLELMRDAVFLAV